MEPTVELLATKIQLPPARPDRVPRPHLVTQLEDGLRRGQKLTLVSAPAGYGKTSLVRDWIAEVAAPVAWLSLDAGDGDPVRFWGYVIAALQTLDREVGKAALAMLQAPDTFSLDVPLTSLINDLAAAMNQGPQASILVLDDYHHVRSLDIHRSIGFFLDHLPNGLHLVITTREDPPLALARRRARGEVNEIRAVALRFSIDEADAFLNAVMDLELLPADIATLEKQTEGWIAGLQMAAVALKGRGYISPEARHQLVTEFSGDDRYVMDYLVEEVLQREPEAVRAFLLRTSILERLSGPLCAAVTGQKDSQAILERLEQANLFVVPLDHRRIWYRYHQLFAQLLRHRLRRHSEIPPADLHRRASRWYHQAGLLKPAVRHALAGEDFDLAATQIEGSADRLWLTGETSTLRHWLDTLPQAAFTAHPRLHLYRALLAIGRGQATEAQRHRDLAAAYPARASDEDQAPDTVVGLVATTDALLALDKQQAELTTTCAEEALRLLPASETLWRSIAATALGFGYGLLGDPHRGRRAFDMALTTARATDNHHLTLTVTWNLALLQHLQGRLLLADRTCREARELIAAHNLRLSPSAAKTFIESGALAYEQDALTEAQDYALEGIAISRQLGNDELEILAHLVLARILQAKGEADAAVDAWEAAQHQATVLNLAGLRVTAEAEQVRWWLAQGLETPAIQWARALDDAQNATASEPPTHWFAFVPVILAKTASARGLHATARQRLEHLLRVAEGAGQGLRQVEILLAQATVLESQGDQVGAWETLARALAMAEPEGYLRTFVDMGPSLARLLYRALEAGLESEYAGRLLAAFPPAHTSSQTVAEELIEPLTERETEILQCIAEGLTNREIAARLFISAGTVKVHTSHIYSKLEVRSRTQAIAKAQALGILTAS